MTAPLADRVREHADLQVFLDAADLLDAIDALPDERRPDCWCREPDAIAMCSGCWGYRLAMRRVKALLHPEGDR